MEQMNLEQIIKEPTRVTSSTATLVDHIYVSNPEKVRAVKISKIAISDHFPTNFIYKANFGNKQSHHTIKFRSFKNFDEDLFLADLRTVPWSVLDTYDDPSDALDTWYSLFLDVVNLHAPLRSERVKKKKQPEWMSDEIVKAMSQRDHFHSNGDTTNYKHWRNVCVSLIRSAKVDYYQSIIESGKKDSSKLWKHLRDLAPKQNRANPLCIEDDGNNISDPKLIAGLFNDYFTSIASSVRSTGENNSENFQLLESFLANHLSHEDKYTIPEIDKNFVENYLMTLPTDKAVGLDGVCSRILRVSATVIAPAVTRILNLSIKSGTFPMQWKIARICPVYNNGSRTDKNNYRPIAILAILSKIIERHVYSSFYEYLNSKKLLYNLQSGFRRGFSCETALAQMLDVWYQNIEHGDINGVVFLDLRKAFDLVDHNILLHKMKLYQCCDTTLSWFQSYLCGRTQKVSIQGHLSESNDIICGVPQGSILGPLLFSIFINDLPLRMEHSSLSMYADDSTLNATGKLVSEIETKLNLDLDNVSSWCNENRMVTNVDKTKAMIITTRQKYRFLDKTDLELFLQGGRLSTERS